MEALLTVDFLGGFVTIQLEKKSTLILHEILYDFFF